MGEGRRGEREWRMREGTELQVRDGSGRRGGAEQLTGRDGKGARRR